MKLVFTDFKTLGFPLRAEALNSFGEVVLYDDLSEEELPAALETAEIVITNRHRLDEKSLSRATNLKLICEAATGYDNIDIDYCRKRGIAVTNVPGYAGTSVAQHTFAMLFYLLGHSKYFDEFAKSGAYVSSKKPVMHEGKDFFELAGKTWGIIGLGNIGSKVAQYAKGFGCRVISSPLEDVLRQSDILSIHAPLTKETYHLIGELELSKMKDSAILLNLGRGGIVDETALAAALDRGDLRAAGLDVTEQEPIEEKNPLLRLKDPSKLYLTPHIAFGSVEARARLIQAVCDNISAFVNGERRNRLD